MHPNPAFRQKSAERNLSFARDRGFGVLVVDGPLLAHVPFLLSDDGVFAELHLVRSNPILREIQTDKPALIAVAGPDAYVSPDWYGVLDQVPTWNYVAVHMRGRLEKLTTDALLPMLDRLSLAFESRMLPKRPWQTDKMTPEVRDRLLRSVVPLRLHIETVDGTWKLGQNKDTTARSGAADGIDAYGIGSETREMAALMRGVEGS